METDAPRIIRQPVPLAEVRELARLRFGDMVKAAVDLGRGLIAVGGELHSDEGRCCSTTAGSRPTFGASIFIRTNPTTHGLNSIR